MTTHETKFDLMQTVKIPGIDQRVVIRQICIDYVRAVTYEVTYWSEGKFVRIWLPEDELRAA